LGRPLPHVRVHVLDTRFRPAPAWATGEIHIGGAGVSRGYLGRPALTAERFVPDPFGAVPGARLYRTGDLARRLADDDLVFLGRADDQVKIRGHRVEPGEIANVLRTHSTVREAAVVLRRDEDGPRLIAYVVTRSGETAELRDHCARRLPDHMVPAAFVPLEVLPRTPNGKLDRAALPEPERTEPGTAYVAPETDAEKTLAEIWAQVLHLDRVGRHDNFFTLGGDSILSIQVVAQATQAGITLTPPLLFQHPTIAELAALGPRVPAVEADQGPVTGPVRPSPVQRWFFEQDLPAPHHYNQAVLLRVREPLDPVALEKSLRALVIHHDSLRLRAFRSPGGEWTMDIAPPIVDYPILTVADLSGLPGDRRTTAHEDLVARAQTTHDLARGKLLHALYTGHHLLLTAHHLATDGISWRILLEHLTAAYGGTRLPRKTTSFQHWTRDLADERPEPAATEPIPRERAESPEVNTYGNARTVTTSLEPRRPVTQDVLLTALAHTIATWIHRPTVTFDVEHHGRTHAPTHDLTRTTGWFTTIHPLTLTTTHDPHTTLQHTKNQLSEADRRHRPSAEIRFNYLGRFDGALGEDAPWELLPDAVDGTADPSGRRPYLLDVNAMVIDGTLRVHWTYCPALHRRETVETLAGRFLRETERVLDGEGGDFTGAGLSEPDLEEFMDHLDDVFASEGEA
ncbi:AMP-binding protein, partial [Amycolatopsis rhizosphaerae]